MPPPASHPMIEATGRLRKACRGLEFQEPVACAYRPLDYAWRPHRRYLEWYGRGTRRVVFLGMNPGPFGMVQTGVPFGEVAAVRDWLGIEEKVQAPAQMHPKRPVEGFACRRSEVSGRRLWGLFAERFGRAEVFFQDHFVLNYCPVAFVEAGGRNLPPDKLPVAARKPLLEACDAFLEEALAILGPDWVIGVGAFAEARLRRVGQAPGRRLGRVLHPSPASPRANRGWAQAAAAELERLGVW